ncbi:hypothetical protein H7Y63_01025 [Polaromonas sp.]|nr:hypothetical protein [Candidatus Saccharibacteria bacterium]
MPSLAEGTPQNRPDSYLYSAEFGVEFSNFWFHISQGMEHFKTPAEMAQLRLDAIENEHKFFDKVFDGVASIMKDAPGKVVCLFDIDNTIAEMSEDDSAPMHKLLRPAFKPVISKLAIKYPEILRFGLLTLLPQDSIKAESVSPTFLSSARPYMDESLFYSSECVTKQDPLRARKTEPHVIGGFLDTLVGVVDPELLAATRGGQADFDLWYDPKIERMASLSAQEPETTFVLVDDLWSAGFFDPANPWLKGICVYDEIQRLLP